MRNTERSRDETALKPIGTVLAAVVAGLPGHTQAAQALPMAVAPEPVAHARVHYLDPTNHPGFEQDESLILGPSEPVEPFGALALKKQPDLFDL